MSKMRCAQCGLWVLPFGRSAEEMLDIWNWHPCKVENTRRQQREALARSRSLHPSNGGVA